MHLPFGTVETGFDEMLPLVSLALHGTLSYEPSSAHSVADLSTSQRRRMGAILSRSAWPKPVAMLPSACMLSCP
jgi:hypothetical protein